MILTEKQAIILLIIAKDTLEGVMTLSASERREIVREIFAQQSNEKVNLKQEVSKDGK